MIGFDLARSDLPLKVEFPILLANVVSWLAGLDSPATQRVVRTGQPVTGQTLAPAARITTPAGDTREVASRDGSFVFADTLRVGKYEVSEGPPLAASLLSEAESNTEPRESLWQAQTPQMFRYGMLKQALQKAGEAPTDEAQAIEALGFKPRLVPGELRNLKVTYPQDLAMAEAILAADVQR